MGDWAAELGTWFVLCDRDGVPAMAEHDFDGRPAERAHERAGPGQGLGSEIGNQSPEREQDCGDTALVILAASAFVLAIAHCMGWLPLQSTISGLH